MEELGLLTTETRAPVAAKNRSRSCSAQRPEKPRLHRTGEADAQQRNQSSRDCKELEPRLHNTEAREAATAQDRDHAKNCSMQWSSRGCKGLERPRLLAAALKKKHSAADEPWLLNTEARATATA